MPYFRLISLPKIVPTVRLRLVIGNVSSIFSPSCSADFVKTTNSWSKASSKPWSCSITQCVATSSGISGLYSTADKSKPLAFQWSTASAPSKSSTLPIRLSNLLIPSLAIISLTSSLVTINSLDKAFTKLERCFCSTSIASAISLL